MSTLPLISHHLFVSAVGHDPTTESEPAFGSGSASSGVEAPLEVIDAAGETATEGRRGAQSRTPKRARVIS